MAWEKLKLEEEDTYFSLVQMIIYGTFLFSSQNVAVVIVDDNGGGKSTFTNRRNRMTPSIFFKVAVL